MSEHTPGPWTTRVPRVPITNLAAGDRMVCARAFDGSEKAVVDRVRGGTPEQANANALLIAAAPDLLAALKAALDEIHESGVGAVADVIEGQGRAAIAKAEGRS